MKRKLIALLILALSALLLPITKPLTGKADLSNGNKVIESGTRMQIIGKKVPIIKVVKTKDGGKIYYYRIYGQTVTSIIPPSNFNPLKATDAQLEEYGFGSKPTDPDALRDWKEAWSHYKATDVPDFYTTNIYN